MTHTRTEAGLLIVSWAPDWRRRHGKWDADGRALSASIAHGVKGASRRSPDRVDAAGPGCQICRHARRADPIALFQRHLPRARSGVPEEVSDAMTLSTMAPGGQSEVPGGAPPGRRPAGIRVLHEPPEREGAGDRTLRPGRAVLPLAPPARPGPDRGPRGSGGQTRGRRLLRVAAARQPARGLGERPEPPASRTAGSCSGASGSRRSGSRARAVPRPPHWVGLSGSRRT